jgi:hypothetical protein
MSLSFKTKAKSLISFPDLSSTVESVAEFKDLFTCQVHFLRIFAQVFQFQHFAGKSNSGRAIKPYQIAPKCTRLYKTTTL